MPRSRNNNQSPISLFPFLAVLISAMGALIFLLIVITNKVRHDVTASRSQPMPLPTISIEPTKPDVLNEQVLIPAPATRDIEPEQPRPVIPSPQIMEETPTVTRHEAAVAIEKLQGEEKLWGKYLSQLDQRLAVAKEKIKELEDEVLSKRASLQAVQQQQEQGLNSSILLGEQTTKLEKELAKYRQQVDQLQKTRVDMQERKAKIQYQAATRSAEFAIIPFEGATGTTRRPIYLECTAEGITFHPEGVTLKISDLEQFTPKVNPLLSGVMVLREYWQKYDHKQNPEDARLPYILIIVRPSGTLAFYGAQSLLQRINTPQGYELVEEDRQLVYPPKSNEARDLLIEAVQSTYKTKAAELNGAGGGLAGTPGVGADFSTDPRWSSRPGPAPNSAGGFPPIGNQQLPGEVSAAESKSNGSSGGGTTSTPMESKPAWVPEIIPGKSGGNQQSGKTGTDANFPSGSKASSQPNSMTSDPANGQPDAGSTQPPQGAATPAPSPSRLTFGEAAQAPGSPAQKLEIQGKPPENSPPLAANKKKTWGVTSSKLIGLEQNLIVKVSADRIQVGDRWVTVGQNETSPQLREAVYEMVVAEVNNWGNPPDGFRWIPSLKCQISPGGNTQFERFAQHLRREGFAVVAEQVFDK